MARIINRSKKASRKKKSAEVFGIKFFLSAAVLMALFIFFGLNWLSFFKVTNLVSQVLYNKFYAFEKSVVAGEFTVQIAQAADPKWNPSYPRVAFFWPKSEAHPTGCSQFRSKFDIVGLSFDTDARCASAIKQANPNMIILATLHDMMRSNDNFQYHTFRYFDPQLAEDINSTSADAGVTNTDGEGFPRWSNPPNTNSFPYGTNGSSVFIVNDRSVPNLSAYTPDHVSYGYNDRNWSTHVDEINKTLQNISGVSGSHSTGSYLRQPIKAADWVPNITPANPYDGQEAARYFIDHDRLDIIDASNFAPYDGSHYATYRTDWPYNSEGGEVSLANNVDFDLNWQRDWDEHGGDWINDQWHQGLQYMWNYERQKMSALKGGAKTIVIANNGSSFPGDSTVSWNEGFFLEYGMLGQYSWPNYYSKLRLWDRDDKYVIAEDGAQKPVYEMSENYWRYWKDRFSDMRYGLTTALMGNAFYGRNFGTWFQLGLWYDEYETNLGYPTGPPHELSNHCSSSASPNGRHCVYVRFFDNGAVIVNPTFSDQTIDQSELVGLAGYGGPYWRFRGGQDPDFNNGGSFTSVLLKGSFNTDPDNLSNSDKDDHGDGILLFTTQDYNVVSDIMVGNYPNNDTSPASEPVQLTGDWDKEPDNASNPYWSQWNYGDPDTSGWRYPQASFEGYGAFYTDGSSGATATFEPTIGVAGDYDIYEWHGWRGGTANAVTEATNVPYEINSGGSVVASGTIDQSINAGQWNRIGTVSYTFPRSTSSTRSYVRISANGANGTVIADVIKFVFTGNSVTPPPPPPPIAQSIVADFNCDGVVDIKDFGILLSHWKKITMDGIKNYLNNGCGSQHKNLDIAPIGVGTTGTVGDDIVDESDFARLFNCWGTPTTPNCLISNATVATTSCGDGVFTVSQEQCDSSAATSGTPANAVCAADCQTWQCFLGYEKNTAGDACQVHTNVCAANVANQSALGVLNMLDAQALPPPVGGNYCDAVFGTQVNRLTGAAGVDTGGNDIGVALNYSAVTHWNSDGSMFYARRHDGTRLFRSDGTDLGLLETVLSEAQIRWTNDPNFVYKINGQRIERCNVTTLACTIVRDFAGVYDQVSWGVGGDLNDSRSRASLTGILGVNAFIFVYDFVNDINYTPTSSWTVSQFNDVTQGVAGHTISAGGNFVIVQWRKNNREERDYGVELFSENMNFVRQLHSEAVNFETGLDTTGAEVMLTTAGNYYLSVHPTSGITNQADIIKVTLSTSSRVVTLLLHRTGSEKVVFSAPNWQTNHYQNIFVSAFSTNANLSLANPSEWNPMSFEIFAVPTDGSGNVRRLVHNRSGFLSVMGSLLVAQPDFSVNWQSNRIVFKSTMNQRGTDLYSFSF